MVLNDGETYTAMDGCKIVEIPNHFEPDDIEDSLKAIRNGINDVNLNILCKFKDDGIKWSINSE